MSQKIYSGKDSYKNIAEIIKEIGTKKLLLVCGNSFDKQDIYPYIMNLPVEIIRFSNVTPNPKYEEVCDGLRIFKANSCDTILAIGGGSYMDVAKCIKLFCRMDECENYLSQPRVDTGIPIIAVPTTAGTGSESTQHSVIYYKGVKQSVSHLSLVPDYVILESDLLKSLPDLQRKVTMLDALSHAVESYWAVKSCEESREYASKAIQLILKYKDEYLNNTEDGNTNMLAAANWAGQAINITATTAGHAMSYKLTSLYGIPHGHACALCLTKVWPYLNDHVSDCIHPNGKEYLENIIKDLSDLFGVDGDKYKAANIFIEFVNSLGLDKVSTTDMNEINELTESVNPERLSNFPVSVDLENIKKLYIDMIYNK